MISRIFALAAVTVSLTLGQGPLNSASYRLSGMPGYGVARGSMFVVYGHGLGPAGIEKDSSLPLDTNLADTTLQVSVGSTSAGALIYYTSTGQVAAVLPSYIPAGNGQIYATYHGRRSDPISI